MERILARIDFSSLEVFVHSSTVPYCIAMKRQNQNDMLRTHNLINSRNDGERKNHIDNDERPVATTNDREEQSTISQFLPVSDVMGCTMALVSCSRVWSFSRNRRPRFTHDNDEKSTTDYDETSKSSPKVGSR